MRDFKFRAWHEYGNRKTANNRVIFEPGMIYDEKPGDCLLWKNQGQKITDIMQFTGIPDQGDEIYEKDIIEFDWDRPDGVHQVCRGIVKYSDKFACFMVNEENNKFNNQSLRHVILLMNGRKIGNIHENPELLKEAK